MSRAPLAGVPEKSLTEPAAALPCSPPASPPPPLVHPPLPPQGTMAKTPQRPALVWSLRACLLLEFCSALGMIIYALILENPPKTALPL